MNIDAQEFNKEALQYILCTTRCIAEKAANYDIPVSKRGVFRSIGDSCLIAVNALAGDSNFRMSILEICLVRLVNDSLDIVDCSETKQYAYAIKALSQAAFELYQVTFKEQPCQN